MESFDCQSLTYYFGRFKLEQLISLCLTESGVRRNVRIPYPYLISGNNPYPFPYPYQTFQLVTYPYPSTYFFSKINPYPVPNSEPILENHPYPFPSPYPFFWLFLRSRTRTYFRTFPVHFTYLGFLESTRQRKSNAVFEKSFEDP